MALPRVLNGAIRRAGAAVDRGALRFMERAMRRGGTNPPADARQKLVALAAHYAKVDDFFPAPAMPEVREHKQSRRLNARHVTDLAFESRWRPTLPQYVDEYASYVENLTAYARLYSAGDEPRTTAILIHGWGGGAYWLEERAFVVSYWLRLGLDVALVQLPFHGSRAPAKGNRRSGALFPSPHVVRTNEAFGQAIHDLRALILYLRDRGAPAIGAMGMSLGGYTTALLATVVEDLAFAVPIIPAADMARLMWSHGEDSPQRRRAEAVGVSGTLLDDVFRIHAPLQREPKVPHERRMIMAGKGDRITTPDQAHDLWKHWGEPTIHWFPGGHLAQIGRGDGFRAIRRHLSGLGLTQ